MKQFKERIMETENLLKNNTVINYIKIHFSKYQEYTRYGGFCLAFQRLKHKEKIQGSLGYVKPYWKGGREKQKKGSYKLVMVACAGQAGIHQSPVSKNSM